ncbi:MAG TPA: hypothetical protein DCZ94_14830 [Lentisphaeria bacterium]|nr:MAG: hypothetical protein A2X48_02985 [Lentisphaerae bacterium GWF2_49_21]HBC88223.1 hypothetical protein [Lentisphaeria bacterium]
MAAFQGENREIKEAKADKMKEYFDRLLKNKYAMYILLFMAAVVPYVSSLNGEFVFDDIPLLLADPFYQTDHSFTDCWKRDYWMETMAQGLYRPLTTFSYWLNFKISGLYSPSFRTVNLLLHLITVFVVFSLALRLKVGRAAALACAVIFAVHPIHTEAVIPSFGRGEVLCGLFVFLGLLFHIMSGKKPFLSIFTALCFILACWSKEHGIALLPLCILYDIYAGRLKMEKKSILCQSKFYGLYVAAALVVAFTRYEAMGSILPAMTRFDPYIDNPLALCSYPVRLLSAINLQGFALLLFVWPKTLSHDYSYAQLLPLDSAADPVGIIGALLVIAIPFILSYFFPKLKNKIIFFSLAYLVCILPAANIITPTGTIFAERLYYIPSIWLCMMLSCLLFRISWKMDKNILVILLLAVVIALSCRTYVRSIDWQDQLRISLSGVKTSPKSAKTWNNLAVQLAQQKKFEEAISACGMAIKIYPLLKTTYLNRAVYNIEIGNSRPAEQDFSFKEAEKDLRKYIELGTMNPMVYNKLGAVLANLGREEEAMKYWKISLNLDGAQTMIKRAVSDLQKEIDAKNSNSKFEIRNPKQ